MAPFIFNEWKFDNSRTISLHDEMNIDEQYIFYLNPVTLDWKPYFINLTLGVRKYLLKEDDKTIKRALNKHF